MRLIVLAACLLCLTMPAVLLADEIGATNKKDTTAAPTRREPAVCVGTFCYSIHSMSGRFASEEHDRMLAAGGGTEATEAAVQAALKWLESRQAVDGSWGFDHNRNTPPDVGDCPNPGTLDARYGATALALLPYLGAGQTHKDGSYKGRVYAGLAYLVKNLRIDAREKVAFLQDKAGPLSHAWATMAMCEAYAMTHDKDLLAPAQLSVNYLLQQQDEDTGGWNSSRNHQDLLLSAWCVRALRAGHLGYLIVPKKNIIRAKEFTASRTHDGTSYRRYEESDPDELSSAAALLSQMQFGWKRDHLPLVKGIENIARIGPAKNDVRWNFFASNALFHYQGEHWEDWNEKLRHSLVRSQADMGVIEGSWYFPDSDGATSGGRLYHTALTALTLEVYYRHRPMYRMPQGESEFPY